MFVDLRFFEKIQSLKPQKGKINYLTLSNLNIQSLANKTDIFSNFLNERQVDIACLTEHWLSYDILQKINLNNHKVVNAYCRETSRHGGAAVIIKKGLSGVGLDELRNLTVERVIELAAVRIKKYNLVAVSLYRTPSADPVVFMAVLNDLLERCYDTYRNDKIVISGDFNIDFAKPSKLRDELLELSYSYNLDYTFHESSRQGKYTDTCIDNVVTNMIYARILSAT